MKNVSMIGVDLAKNIMQMHAVDARGRVVFRKRLARHKLLDLIGDLYLLGRPVQASIVAHNTGHRLHRAFAEALARHAESGEAQFLTEG